MKRMKSVLTAIVILFLVLAGCPGAFREVTAVSFTINPAAAAEWPVGSTQLLVAAGAGGGTDITARIFAESLQKITDKPFVVVNMTEGGGSVCFNQVKDASTDGSVMGFLIPSWFTTYLSGIHDCNPLEDYDIAAAWTTIGSYFIVVSPDSPYKTLDDLIADCKARPGQITFAIQIGSMSHYFIEEVASKAGIKFKYVEAGTGDSERIVALMGGHVDVSLINPAQTTQYVKAGELVALASLMKNSEDADPSIKNVPVVSASGLDEGTLATMFVIALPKGTDPEVLQAMSDAYKAAQADSELQQKLKNANMETALFYEYGKAKDAVIAMYNTFSQLAGTFGIKAPGR